MGSSSNGGVYEPPLAAQSLSATSEMISSPLDATTAECTVAEKMVAYAHPPLPTATGHVTRHVKVKPLYPAREPFRRVRGDHRRTSTHPISLAYLDQRTRPDS